MINIWERPNVNSLTEKSLAYLVSGVFLSISHYIHESTFLVFFGHLLISSSLLILVSLMLNKRWMHRISAPLETFSIAIFIISFSAGIIIFFVDELAYYKDFTDLPVDLINSLFCTIIIAIIVWLILLSIPYGLPALRVRLPFRRRIPSYIFIVTMALFITNHLLKLLPDQYFLSGELVIMLVIISVLNKDKSIRLKRTTIYLSHLFFALFFSFFISAILAFFTEASSHLLFIICGLASLALFIISILSLNRWRRRLLRALCSFAAIIKTKAINVLLFLGRLLVSLFCMLIRLILGMTLMITNVIINVKNTINSIKIYIKRIYKRLK